MDILDGMTKFEIIDWLRGQAAYIFRPPRKSDLLFIRWQRKTKELQKKDSDNIAELENTDFSIRDRYAKLFNASSDNEERYSLIKKMAPYEKLLTKNISESQKIRKEYQKLDRLYEQIDIERKKETNEQ